MSSPFKTIIEPFRIHSVEPLKLTTEAERRNKIKDAGYNLFNLRAEDVLIDLAIATTKTILAMKETDIGGSSDPTGEFAEPPALTIGLGPRKVKPNFPLPLGRAGERRDGPDARRRRRQPRRAATPDRSGRAR